LRKEIKDIEEDKKIKEKYIDEIEEKISKLECEKEIISIEMNKLDNNIDNILMKIKYLEEGVL